MLVVKRDGSEQKFNSKKIERAVGSVLDGLGSAKMLTDRVVGRLLALQENKVPVASVQEAIEAELIDSGFTGPARDYISYRAVRDNLRRRRGKADVAAFGKSIIASKYTRKGETWEDAVDRMMDMHIKFWTEKLKDTRGIDAKAHSAQIELRQLIEECREAVKKKEIVGSMRALQMGGAKILKHNDSMFNCSFTHISNFGNVQKAFFRLLCGCGVGYSVQLHHVAKLPKISAPDKGSIVHWTIADTIEGWADALGALLRSYALGGGYVEFNYSNIRPAGSRLKTTGGTAPGHMGLKAGLDSIRGILDSVVTEGGTLRPIHMHDVMCYAASAVLSGGVRRSAMLALFSVNDGEMMMAKSPGHFSPMYPGNPGKNAQREYANNSVALLRSKCEMADFKRILDSCRNFGEPGFFFTDDLEYGPNPCGEINMLPLTDGTDRIQSSELGTEYIDSEGDQNLVSTIESGFSFCNLTEINGATCVDEEDFFRRCRLASVLGTLQAGYTDFKYLDGETDKEIADRDALLGVSITGIMNNPDLLLHAENLRTGSELVHSTNEQVAKILGINSAARLTCVKPSGTASKALSETEVVGSGIHGLWSRRWIQGVTYTADEDALKCVLRDSPIQATLKPDGNYFVEWPLSCSDSAITMKDLDAVQQLSNIGTLYKYWVKPGTARGDVTHNVSCTVTVRDDEWDRVGNWIWSNRGWLAALTFVPDLLEMRYPYAPFKAVSDAATETRYNELVAKMKPITWEIGDVNHATDTAACAGGACEI